MLTDELTPYSHITVSSVVLDGPMELHNAQADVVSSMGYLHRYLEYDAPLADRCDVLLVQGPYGPIAPVAAALRDYAPGQRPVLAYWFQQSLDVRLPPRLNVLAARLRSTLNRPPLSRVGARLSATRMGYLGDILWLKDQGLLDVLAVSGSYYRDYFAARGIPTILVPRGYYPGYGKSLHLDRDVAVTWMGKTRNERRRKIVYDLRDELASMGYEMRIHDGVTAPFIFGEERTELLNRSRFVLNALPFPTAELSIRYYFAAANGAVVLSEPTMHEYPFVPGQHLVECAVDQMAGMVHHYAQHEEERLAIADQMLRLMQTELTLERSISQILQAAGL